MKPIYEPIVVILVVVMLLRLFMVVHDTAERSTQYVVKLPTKTNRESVKQKLIIITTFMRSGSTFVGELFNLHSEVFYQFEPLHPNASVSGFSSTF